MSDSLATAIAVALRTTKPGQAYSELRLIQHFSDCLAAADALEDNLPGFNRLGFLLTCGYEAHPGYVATRGSDMRRRLQAIAQEGNSRDYDRMRHLAGNPEAPRA